MPVKGPGYINKNFITNGLYSILMIHMLWDLTEGGFARQ